MFARHTRPRMKISGVLLGWKSFVDKIHPQLPLTTKESQRLLTALTSSFRKHLDETHPIDSAEYERRPRRPEASVAKPQLRARHSSASYADKHMASVLTNPLFVKGGQRLDYTSAKIELTKNPSKDPIELLEQYHEQHAATPPIAELCLQQFLDGLKSLTPERQLEQIRKYEPGRRVFLWLLQSGLADSNPAVDNLKLLDDIVYVLLQEGRENSIWDWMQLDMQLASSEKMTAAAVRSIERMMHSYRWRGRLLRALVHHKLEHYPIDKKTNLNDALEAFFKACDIKSSAMRGHHLKWIPLATPLWRIMKAIATPLKPKRRELDAEILDKLIDYLPLALSNAPEIYRKSIVSNIMLAHPTKCSASAAYDFLQDLFGESPSSDAASFLPRIRQPSGPESTKKWFTFMGVTIAVLRAEGSHEKASWADSVCRREFPTQARYLDKDVRSNLRKLDVLNPEGSDEQELQEPRIAYPTFV